ncbi:MAG TPA: hypothetical protein VGK87_01535, partial [Anaerolineae bacterium]
MTGSFYFVRGWLETEANTMSLATAECPECGSTITFKSDPVMHELVRCPDCGSELEV